MTSIIFADEHGRQQEEFTNEPVTVVQGDVRVVVTSEGVSIERFDPEDEDRASLDENWFIFNDVVRPLEDPK